MQSPNCSLEIVFSTRTHGTYLIPNAYLCSRYFETRLLSMLVAFAYISKNDSDTPKNLEGIGQDLKIFSKIS